MAAVNSVQSTRLPLPTFSPRAVLMYSAAVGGEGAVALQLREAAPGELDAARLHDDRLAITCNEPELLADLLHAAADIDGEHDGLTALLGAASPDLALASDASDSLPLPDPENDCTTSSSSNGVVSGITRVSVAVTGLDSRPSISAKKVRPKPASPNRQGPQQCQVCNKIFGNASALAKHKLTHSDERKYVCITCAKAFKRQDHLNGHMLTHRNKKPYECKADGCGKSYCDARSLRRHTENHHQPSADTGTSNTTNGTSSTDRDSNSHRVASPTSPARSNPPHSESSNSGSEKSNGTSAGGSGSGGGSDSSPPCTPPAPPTPPSRPKSSKASSTKPKSSNSAQQNQKSGSGNSASGTSSAASGSAATARASDVKPVECNLCHRKFKNIPALNGHMRLHGGYFKKDSDNKKLDKKESTGPPLQTASVSVRALIEEKIISRRGATATSTPTSGTTDTVTSRTGFVAPAPPPLSTIRASTASPASPAATTGQFVSPRAPPVVTVATNVTANMTTAQRDSTLIELLKKGSTKVVKRSASDPGQSSPQQEFTFRPELFGVSFNSDDGYFSPALNDDTFQFTTTPEQLEELASLEDYATVAASIRERSPITFPSSRRLAAVLNSPLPESLADFGACHGGSPVPSPGIAYSATSPGLSYTTGDSPGLAYTAASPVGSYSTQPEPSPGLAYPTPPASHDAQSPAHTAPRASSPLSAAFFTATMSSQEEVEEALEEVLPEECRSLDAYALEPSPTPRRIMLNSEDPLLSSSPRDFSHQRPARRHNRMTTSTISTSMHQWQHDTSSLQVCVEGRDTVPAVFLSPNSVPASPQRRKRRASPAGPYRSRMRRTVNHFTPQPILPPERDGSGLLTEIIAGLPTPESDVLSHLDEPRQPQINIGRDHQAEIPELYNDRVDLHRGPEQLLWDPGINDCLDDNEVRMFMELAMCAAMPVGGHTREFALQTLGECGGDIRAATLRLMSRPAAPTQHESRWAPDEVEAFLAGLGHYDKDFYRIAQLVRTKDSKQCIQFYYFWKKVTKDYKTMYLRSWIAENQTSTQGTVGQVSTHTTASCTSSPTSFEGEEFPCKICGKVFNKVKSRSAHMKSHRPLDAEAKRPKLEKPYEKVERSDERPYATADYQSKLPAQ
ncbi:zinc finger protein 541 [Galleria mellonella]|uniref:Zinc finger protein 541 n=1 Tax=Galleria mellonella TaxID=7137 RepID=A0A6J1WX13_GALME|nr:zinc finger protein 541 [Galleria mellonella]